MGHSRQVVYIAKVNPIRQVVVNFTSLVNSNLHSLQVIANHKLLAVSSPLGCKLNAVKVEHSLVITVTTLE